MSIVFFGTASFAVPALEACAQDVVCVVSQPRRPHGRGLELTPSPVEAKAIELGIPVLTPEKCRASEFIERLAAYEADLFLVAAYGQILPQRLLDLPRSGCVNVHGSVLPRHRGAAPVQYSIWTGDLFSGVTLIRMDAGMDTGDVIAVETTAIGPDETARELYDRLARLGGELVLAWSARLQSGDYPTEPQDNEQATLAPKIRKEDALLRWDEPIEELYRRFRAMTPVPGAYFETTVGRLRVYEMRAMPGLAAEPGVVLASKPELVVGVTGGAVALYTVQAEGKKKGSGRDFLNGARLLEGDCLRD